MVFGCCLTRPPGTEARFLRISPVLVRATVRQSSLPIHSCSRSAPTWTSHLQHCRLDRRRRHLMRARRRTMGPVGQPLQALSLIASEPAVHRLPGDAPLLSHRRHRMALGDHRQHRETALLRHAQLPHPGSVKDQPKQLSTTDRNTVAHHPTLQRQASGETTHPTRWAPWGSNPQPAD